jgi:hypothetical protein
MTAAAAERKGKAKIRQAWIDDLHRRRNVTPVEKLVGTRIALHQNLTTGACYPSAATLSGETGIPERSVFRAIDGLRRKGRLMVKSGGRGRANQYLLAPPTPDKVTGVTPDKPTLTRCQANLKESEGEAKASPLAGRETEPSVLNPSGSARAPLAGAAEPLEEPEGHLEAEPGGASPSNGGDGDGRLHAAWRALVELWEVRPWPITPRELAIARAAFVTTVAAGTPIDAILAGAGAWVSGINDPRYLKALPQWLQAKAWEHGPPAKRKRQAPQPSGQGRGRREKTDLTSLMHQLGQM